MTIFSLGFISIVSFLGLLFLGIYFLSYQKKVVMLENEMDMVLEKLTTLCDTMSQQGVIIGSNAIKIHKLEENNKEAKCI
jgi:hypothetical protein